MGTRISARLLLAIGLLASCFSASANPRLLLFGGPGHRVFLGCLNCDRYSNESVQNQYSDYGSRYSDTSVLNPYSDYGSKYSDYGACNRYASDPPVIVDDNGNYYGRLTVNRYADQTRMNDVAAWISGVCA